MDAGLRLWRARRRHDRIDAYLRGAASRWIVEYVRNDRPMLARPFASEKDARADAGTRLKELLRAGWIDHW